MPFNKSKYICPFCFTEHKMEDIEYRCTNRRCPEGEVPDLELTSYETNGRGTPTIKRLPTFPLHYRKCSNPNCKLKIIPLDKCPVCRSPLPEKILGAGYECPKCHTVIYRNKCPDCGAPINSKVYNLGNTCPHCGEMTNSVLCPTCHNRLPESTLEGRNIIISIIGSRDSGKSNYVGVLIKELIERISPEFDGFLKPFDDTMVRYRDVFENTLYGKSPRRLTQTQSVFQNNGVYKPLIFSFIIRKRRFLREYNDSFTFAFFDTAGEDLRDFETMSTVTKYIAKSSAIIYLLDPLKIPRVVDELDSDTVERAATASKSDITEPTEIMNYVSALIRREREYSERKAIDIPVAVVFSKFDTITSLLPQGTVMMNPSPHCHQKAFVKSDYQNVDMEVRALLNEWGQEHFMSQVEAEYSNHAFFVTSAFGLHNNAKIGGSINRPNPHRIEDALLWILAEEDFIETV